jgi:hypothetical protein
LEYSTYQYPPPAEPLAEPLAEPEVPPEAPPEVEEAGADDPPPLVLVRPKPRPNRNNARIIAKITTTATIRPLFPRVPPPALSWWCSSIISAIYFLVNCNHRELYPYDMTRK